MKNSFWIIIVLAAALAGSQGCGPKEQAAPAGTYDVLNPSGNFVLHDQDGRVFRLKDHRGESVLLFFGYLSCPDVCPTTLSKLARVYALLGDAGSKVLTLFVTVDPERDTPSKLKEYLAYFQVRALGLTGSKPEIDAVVDAYKGTYEKVETGSAMGYLFNHSDYVYLIGGDGKVRALFHPDDKAEDMAAAIKKSQRGLE